RLERDHGAIAERRRFLVERWTDEDAVFVFALGPITDPPAIGEFALMTEGIEHGVIKLTRRLAVLCADRHIANHVSCSPGWPDRYRSVWNESRTNVRDRPDSGHRLLQILVDLVEEALGRQPFLLRTDEKGQILRHVARL